MPSAVTSARGSAGLTAIQVQRGFRYAGGAAVHPAGRRRRRAARVRRGWCDGAIARFYWFQFESLLPAATGAYDYSKDTRLSLAGVRASVRRYTAPPERW